MGGCVHVRMIVLYQMSVGGFVISLIPCLELLAIISFFVA